MSVAHQRLRAIERNLRHYQAQPMYTDDEIDLLDDDQAERIARAEGDRLAQLAQLEAEITHTETRRGRQPPEQGRLW